mmetsp:Transcript_56521/g.143229  ORF Transcript_56521/g.143229 Transcript_56521/m.143229 type:complete len:218 (+) Transcript_56521:480-1133(+)
MVSRTASCTRNIACKPSAERSESRTVARRNRNVRRLAFSASSTNSQSRVATGPGRNAASRWSTKAGPVRHTAPPRAQLQSADHTPEFASQGLQRFRPGRGATTCIQAAPARCPWIRGASAQNSSEPMAEADVAGYFKARRMDVAPHSDLYASPQTEHLSAARAEPCVLQVRKQLLCTYFMVPLHLHGAISLPSTQLSEARQIRHTWLSSSSAPGASA